MLSLSNRKTHSAPCALSFLFIAVLLRPFWWDANQAVQTEDGVLNYSMAYAPKDKTEFTFTEPKYETALGRYLYRAFLKVVIFWGSDWHSVDFLNARKADIDYHAQGFSLIESPIEELDWSVLENRQKFYSEMEPIIEKLHPETAQIFWFDDAFLQRKTNGLNEPAVNSPHLDYHPNQTLVEAWAGYNVTDFDMILGLWKPDNMDTPVVDLPLAVIDGTSFDPKGAIPFYGEAEQTTMDGRSFLVRFVSSTLKYSPKHRYYYYPEQTSNEVLLFRQYTNEKTVGAFANPHTSFKVPHSPKGAPGRRSVEMRVGITFTQDDAIKPKYEKFGVFTSA